MSNVWLRIRVWTKIILFFLAGIYVLAFLLMNSGQSVSYLWVFPTYEFKGISVLVLMFMAFAIGVVGTLLVRMTFTTLRQFRELRERSRLQRIERQLADEKTKAGRLHTRPESRPQNPSENP